MFFKIIIFFIVLLVYIHMMFHLKSSNIIDMYYLNNINKSSIESMCDTKQPYTMYYFQPNHSHHDFMNCDILFNKHTSYNINIRNNTNSEIQNSICFLPLSVESFKKLIATNNKYISEYNQYLLKDVLRTSNSIQLNQLLRPPLWFNESIDILIGNNNTHTPLKYDICSRNYHLVTQGKINVKLFPSNQSMSFNPLKDYVNFEFRSEQNVWDNDSTDNVHNFKNENCINIELSVGQILYIPPYWWYSFQMDKENTSVLNFKYNTYVSSLTNIFHSLKHYLQIQNTVYSSNHSISTNNNDDNNEKIKEESNILEKKDEIILPDTTITSEEYTLHFKNGDEPNDTTL